MVMEWLVAILGVVSAGGLGYMFIPGIRNFIDDLLGRKPPGGSVAPGRDTGQGPNSPNDPNAQLAQARAQAQAQQQQLDQARNAQRAAEARATQLQTQLERVQSERASLETRLAEAQQRVEREQAAAAQAQQQQAETQADVTRLTQTLAALQGAGPAQQQQVTALQEQLRQSQLAAQQAQQQAADRQAALQAQLAGLQGQLAQAQGNQPNQTRIQGQIDALNARIAQDRLQTTQASQRADERQASMQRQVTALQGRMAQGQQNQDGDQLRAQVATLQADLEAARRRANDENGRAMEAEAARRQAAEELDELRRQQAAQRDRIEELERQLRNMRQVNIDGAQGMDHYFVPRIQGGRVYNLNNNRAFNHYQNGPDNTAVPEDPRPREEIRDVVLSLPDGAGWESVRSVEQTATHLVITIRDPNNNEDAVVRMPRETNLTIRGPDTYEPINGADPRIQQGRWQIQGSSGHLATREEAMSGPNWDGNNPQRELGLTYLQEFGNLTHLRSHNMQTPRPLATTITLPTAQELNQMMERMGINTEALGDFGRSVGQPLLAPVTPIIDIFRRPTTTPSK